MTRPSSPTRATPRPRGTTSPCAGSTGSDTDPGGRAWRLPAAPRQPATATTRRSAPAERRMREFFELLRRGELVSVVSLSRAGRPGGRRDPYGDGHVEPVLAMMWL